MRLHEIAGRILREGYAEFPEIKRLVQDICEKIAEGIPNGFDRVVGATGQDYSFIDVYFDFTALSSHGYNVLADFIENSRYTFEMKQEDHQNAGGFQGGAITINLNERRTLADLEKAVEPYRSRKIGAGNKKKALADILIKSVGTVIIHEVQHAFDYYRSDSLYDDTKQVTQYEDLIDKIRQSGSYPEGVNRKTLHDLYLGFPHEYWARFSQTVLELDLTQPLNALAKDFISKFVGWHAVDDRGRRRLLASLSKLYYLTKEKKQP
jgi:hypothetical protein